jgi:hypothetical protein
METMTLKLALIDWIAIALLIGGYFYGLNKGLGTVFGILLWLLASMWIAKSLAPTLVKMMPNTEADADEWYTLFMAYGAVTGALLALPLLGRIVAAKAGKKKEPGEAHSKHFGSLVGVASAAIFFTLLCPYAHRFGFVSKSYKSAKSPYFAAALAEHMSYVFPASHVLALHTAMGSEAKSEHNDVRRAQGKTSLKRAAEAGEDVPQK